MEISSDRGSTPRRSTKTEQVNLCICYYRIQEYVLFGVSKKIKSNDIVCYESDIQCRYFYAILWI